MNIIYALCDPTTEEVRYIGKSVKGLLRCHEHWRRRNEDKNSHFRIYRWLRTLSEPPIAKILETCESKEMLSDREIYWISHYKSDRLTNMTKGGDGTVGHIHSVETRRKISTRTKGRVSNNLGSSLSEERKAHLAECQKAFASSPEGKAALSERQKRRMAKPSELAKVSALLETYRKRKQILCSNGVVYPSIRQAARDLGLHSPNIVAVLKGRYSQISGLTFTYVENS